jgi:hypothetical protein
MYVFCGKAREVGAAFEFEFVAALRTFIDSRMNGGQLSLTYFSIKLSIKSYRECHVYLMAFISSCFSACASAASASSVNFWDDL